MKQLLYIGSGVVIVILTTLIIITLQGRQIRQTKLDNGLTELMEEYMEEAYVDSNLKGMNDKEFVEWFQANLQKRVNEEGEYEVVVNKRDMENGILSLKVVETYEHISGDVGKITAENVVIKEEEEMTSMYEVVYNLPKELAKEYRIPELVRRYVFPIGTDVSTPIPPTLSGKEFIEWKEEINKPFKHVFVAVYQ